MPQCTASSPVEGAGPVRDRLGQTDRRRQSAYGSADSARMPPRDAETTAPAAPQADPIRTRRRRAREGPGQDSAPNGRGEVPEDLPDDGGIVQRGDQAQSAPTLGTLQHVDAEGPVHLPWRGLSLVTHFIFGTQGVL